MFCTLSGTTAVSGSRPENCSIALIESQFVTIRNSTPSGTVRLKIEASTNPGIFESCGNVSVRRCATYSSACVDLASPRQWREIMLDCSFSSEAGSVELLPSVFGCRSRKEFGVHDLGQDPEALDNARARSVEVGGAVDSVDV